MKQVKDEGAATMETFVWDIDYKISFAVAKPTSL
jgi:hypothetical protein